MSVRRIERIELRDWIVAPVAERGVARRGRVGGGEKGRRLYLSDVVVSNFRYVKSTA